MTNNKVSDTAFLVNWGRARFPELSKDPWAHLWATPQSKIFAEGFRDQVTQKQPLLPSLRNRYFLEAILSFQKQHPDFNFLNIAAGFSSYPYFIDAQNPVFEIDLPHVIEYKKEKLAQWHKTGEIPNREIHFLSFDLTAADAFKNIEDLINKQKSHGPFFVLMEGLLYYLPRKTVDGIFATLGKVLPTGSQVGMVAWSSTIQNNPGVKKMAAYFHETLGLPPQEYTWLDADYFKSRAGFKLVDTTDYPSLEKKYCAQETITDPTLIIDEAFYLLERAS